jgi:hypothetical protein
MDTLVVALGLTTFACLLAIGGQFLHMRNLTKQLRELRSKHSSLLGLYESQCEPIKEMETVLRKAINDVSRAEGKVRSAEYQISYLRTVNAAIAQGNPLESIVAKTTATVFTNLQSAMKKDESS